MLKTLLAAGLCCLMACGDRQSQTPQLQSSGSNNTEIVHSMFDAFNRHDWKAMVAFYSDTAKFLDPSLGQDYVPQTRQQTIDKYAGMQQVFPDIRDDIVNIVTSGNKIAVEFVSSGRSADGATFRLPICSILTIENGLIVRDATYYDK